METIKAFSFICFGLTVLMLLWSLIDLFKTKSSMGDSAAGGSTGDARRSKAYSESQTYPAARNASEAPAQPAVAMAQQTETTLNAVSVV